jgi:AcrR family transcriptional regulator
MHVEGREAVSDTRERLLRAGGEIFAEQGFRSATVREISRRANVNVAAVNYHFRGKEGLYSSVLRYTLDSAIKKYPLELGLKAGATPEEALRAFIRLLLSRVLDDGRPAWHGKLMAREFIEPTAALDQMIEEAIQPLYQGLSAILRQLMGPEAEDDEVRMSLMSIVGQCIYYFHVRPVVEKIYQREFGPKDLEQLSEHVTRFSLGGIEALRRYKQRA